MKNVEFYKISHHYSTPSSILINTLSSENMCETIQVHRQAFRGYLNTQLGDTYLRAFFGWFYASEQGIMLGAFDKQNHLMGYVLGAPVGYQAELNQHVLGAALLGSLVHLGVFLNPRFINAILLKLGLGRSLAPKAPQLPSPVMSLVGIGVSPQAQGSGVGKTLIQAFEKKALERNMKSMRLSVYPENQVARRLYESTGWQAFSEPVLPSQAMYYSKVLA